MLLQVLGELLLLLQQMVLLADGADGGVQRLQGHLADVDLCVLAVAHQHRLDNVAVAVLGAREHLEHDGGALVGREGQVVGRHAVAAVLGVEDGRLVYHQQRIPEE